MALLNGFDQDVIRRANQAIKEGCIIVRQRSSQSIEGVPNHIVENMKKEHGVHRQ